MIEATCSACGTVNRIAEADVPAGAKFVTCTSCKSRVMLPNAAGATPAAKPVGPKPISIPTPAIPKIPGPAKPAELSDLPAPKRQSALAGMDASKPAPKSGLDLADLPAPKAASTPKIPSVKPPAAAPKNDLDLDDLLPAPKTASAITDLPAPKKPTAPAPKPVATKDIADLPAPKKPATPATGVPRVPPPRAAATPPAGMPKAAQPPTRAQTPVDLVDLPAPKDITDLPAPKQGGIDLPAPKGFFDDLPQPAKAQRQKQGGIDLPAPKGFFDDLPQPATTKPAAPELPAPKGFFDDLPQPATTKPQQPGLPAPKGFFDDLPGPTQAQSPGLPAPQGFFDDLPGPTQAQPPAPKGFFDDLEPAAPKAAPAAKSGGGGVFDDLPEPGGDYSGDLLGNNDLDLGPAASGPALELEGHGEPASLDLGLPAAAPARTNSGDFADLDLSSPTAPPPPQVKSGISIKSTAQQKPIEKPTEISPAKSAAEIRLDLETEKEPGLVTPARRDAAKKRAAAVEATAESKERKAKRRKIVLGAVLGLALVGSGGGYFYKRYTDKKARQAEVAEHVEAAKKQIHDANPKHWSRAASEAGAALDLESGNVDAIGLQAEALLGGAIDTGVGGDNQIAQGRKKLADALEAGVTGPGMEAAQALGMIAQNQPQRAIDKLNGMLQREPKNGFWLLYLGWAQMAKGDAVAAIKSFDAALAADPKTKLPVLYARGKAKLAQGDEAGAKQDFAAVLEIQKDHIGAQVGLAATLPASASSQRESDLLAILARKDLAQGDPRAVVQAWTLAADVARMASRLDVARDRYHKALALSKNDVPALVGNAKVEIRDTKFPAAQELVTKALARDADNPDAQMVLAQLDLKTGKVDDAWAICQKLAARQPPLPTVQMINLLLVTGDVLEVEGKADEAIAKWTEAAKLAGDSDLTPMMEAVTKLGELAKKASDLKDTAKAADYRSRADALLQSIADKAQDDAALSKALGVAYLGADDATKAEHFLRRSVEMKGDDVDTHLALAKALSKLGRTDEAIAQLQEAAKLDPTRADIALEIARTLEEAGRLDEAAAAYQKLLSVKDPPTQAQVRAGKFLAKQGKIADAVLLADPILKAEPDNAAGHYLKGEGFIVANKLEDARKELTRAVDADADPQYLDALGRAAELSAAAGDEKYYDLSLRSYERAAAAAPNLFNPQAGQGRIYIQRKEWSKATVPLLAASKLKPDDPEVMFNIGLSYKQQGQSKVAAQWFESSNHAKRDAETTWQLAQLYMDANDPKIESTLRLATELGAEKETKSGTKIDWLTDAYYSLGQIEYGLHNMGASKKAYESFVGRNPPAGVKLKEANRLLSTELR
ncbi:MAG: tetratricopeptide repeat protein [Kofleriaceae bacterium]